MEDMIEKIKEYKLFLGIAVIGLLVGGYFILQQPKSSTSTVPDLYQASSVSSSQKKTQVSSSKEEKTSPSMSEEAEVITVDVKGAVKQP